MITYVRGNIFESPASTLVNTVNTGGVMGRGIAAEFKRLYPEMFKQYRIICEEQKLTIGTLWLYPTEHKSVLNFPTKESWRRPSKLEYIEEGLRTFMKTYERVGISSIAFPALGCGNGGLDFDTQVRPLMENYLKRVAASVFIYPHQGSGYLPEHLTPEEMSSWLRTAPEQLSFLEVWEDLRNLLNGRQTFETFSKGTQFSAQMVDEPKGVHIRRSGGKQSTILYEDILDFWQQLRSFGFTSSRSAPAKLSRDVSYIAPILAALEYIRPVRIAEDFVGEEDFEREAEYALQVVPRAGKAGSQLDLMATA